MIEGLEGDQLLDHTNNRGNNGYQFRKDNSVGHDMQ